LNIKVDLKKIELNTSQCCGFRSGIRCMWKVWIRIQNEPGSYCRELRKGFRIRIDSRSGYGSSIFSNCGSWSRVWWPKIE